LVCNLGVPQQERQPQTINGRRPNKNKKLGDDLIKNENGRQPTPLHNIGSI
jgi:hypothetical protein